MIPVNGLFNSWATPATNWPRRGQLFRPHELVVQAGIFDGDRQVRGKHLHSHDFRMILPARSLQAKARSNPSKCRAKKSSGTITSGT